MSLESGQDAHAQPGSQKSRIWQDVVENVAGYADNPNMSFYPTNVPSKNMIVCRSLCFALVLGFAANCLAQRNTSDIDRQFTADVLKIMLFAKTAEERQYCDYVIKKRDDGTIPARILYGAYQKAMTQERNRRFIYFKTALEILCKREGIVLNPPPVRSTPATSPFFSSAFRGLF